MFLEFNNPSSDAALTIGKFLEATINIIMVCLTFNIEKYEKTCFLSFVILSGLYVGPKITI